jgi:beta-1,4-N-acetylglucosaminyltransferase
MNTTHFVSTGPGTCVPLFYIFFFLRILKLSRARLIFFESWCRVQDLSLSGKLVRPITDEFVVHWPELASKYKNCKYFGKII